MIEPDYQPNMYRHQLEKLIKEGEVTNVKGVVDLLFGDYEERSQYIIKDRWQKIPEKTFLNRLNTLWVYPVFILTIPFSYLFRGDFHITKGSKVGKILIKLIGDYN